MFRPLASEIRCASPGHRVGFALPAIIAALVLLYVSPISSLQATEFSWDVGNGSFGAPSSWAPNSAQHYGPPSALDSALFALSGSHVVSFDGDYNSTDAVVREGSYRFDLAGHTYSLETEAYVGDSSGLSGHLDLVGGTLQSVSGYIAAEAGSAGTVTVDGFDSLWCNTGSLYVGGREEAAGGVGQLDVLGGGTVDSGSLLKVWNAGNVSLNGGEIVVGGSAVDIDGRLTIGSDTVGELSIVGSGWVSSVSSCLGYDDTGIGTATVSGAGSTWANSGHFYVGGQGRGVVNVIDGGDIFSENGIIGDLEGSAGEVTVSGSGSAWTNSVELYVGFDGVGTLNVVDGGKVSNTYCYIGAYEESTGSVTVSGAGSTWTNTGEFYVGQESRGTLNVFNGGLVSVGDELTIDDSDDGDSFVRVGSGGMLAMFGDADDSISQFLELISGDGEIQYWSQLAWGWVDIASAAPGADYTLDYQSAGDLVGYTLLTVTAAPADMLGDTNGDFIVDYEDYDNLVAQFGGPPGGESADFNRDGVVNLLDFVIIRNNFGAGTAGGPEASLLLLTPEPTTPILLGWGFVFLKRSRRSF